MVNFFKDMYNLLSIPACDGRTDGQTDRQIDRQTSCHGIVRAMHRPTRRAVKIVHAGRHERPRRKEEKRTI